MGYRDSLSCRRFPQPPLLTLASLFLALCLAQVAPSLPPTSCCASCVVCILARPISEPSFPLSHTMDFFLFFTPSAKSNSWCQQNMFFISWKMPPTKTHVAENVRSELRTSLTAPEKKLIECYKESLEEQWINSDLE